MRIELNNGSVIDLEGSTNTTRGNKSKQLKDQINLWNNMYDNLSKGDIFNLLMESIQQISNLEESLKEIESKGEYNNATISP